MPSYSRKIKVPGKTARELFDAITNAIDEKADRMAFIGEVKVKRDPDLMQVSASASMFSATLKCQDDGITIDGRMSLLAMALKPKIDGEIDKWIAEAFGNQSV